MERKGAWRALVGVAVLLGSLQGTAWAEPTAADRETARGLMVQGLAQAEKGEHAAALKSFQAADAIMHVPTTTFAVAKEQAALGQLLEARDSALQVQRLPSDGNESEAFTRARRGAKQLADDLAPRIPSLTVQLKNAPPDITPIITLDGQVIPQAVGVPRKLNPGHHTLAVKVGQASGSAELDIEEGQNRTATIDVDESARPAAPDGAANRKATLRTFSYIGMGVGAAGVLVGSVTGILSLTKTSSLQDQCPRDTCPRSVYDSSGFKSDLSQAKTTGDISTVAFIVGGVGAAAGVVLYFMSAGGSAKPPPAKGQAAPRLMAGPGGLAGTF